MRKAHLLPLTLLASHLFGSPSWSDDYAPTPADSTCNPGEVLPGKWKPGEGAGLIIRVYFNASLDPVLEGANNPGHIKGDDADRQRVFLKAVDDWNAVLASVGADIMLDGDTTGTGEPDFARDLWATDQDPFDCPERDSTGMVTTNPVFNRDYTNHEGDGDNVVSTGHNHTGANVDTSGAALGAGWIVGELVGTYDIDGLLGETNVQYDPGDATCIVEADIAWFTHAKTSIPACMRIAWDYTGPNVACGENKLDPNYYDFYSVILHELGHLLGLDHSAHGDPDCHNVMQPMLRARERTRISSKEEACLKHLYGPQVAVNEPGPAARLLTLSPNPMTRSTRIHGAVPAGETGVVRVFDVRGHLVRTLFHGVSPGEITVSWDGRDDRGTPARVGVYFVRLESSAGARQEKITLRR